MKPLYKQLINYNLFYMYAYEVTIAKQLNISLDTLDHVRTLIDTVDMDVVIQQTLMNLHREICEMKESDGKHSNYYYPIMRNE